MKRPPVPPLFSSFDRHSIFKKIYPDEVRFQKTDPIFSLNSIELLNTEEFSEFRLYINALKREEEAEEQREELAKKAKIRAEEEENFLVEQAKKAKIRAEEEENFREEQAKKAKIRAEEEENFRVEQAKLRTAKSNFLALHGDYIKSLNIDKNILCGIIGFSLIPFMNGRLYGCSEKKIIANKIMNRFGRNTNKTLALLDLLKLNDFDDIRPFVPKNTRREPFAPSALNGLNQKKAQENNENFIYGYPFDILTQFPVFLCHSVFEDFMDIIEDNENSSAIKEYNEFMEIKMAEDNSFKFKIDKCVQKLISAFLTENALESQFVEAIVSALKNLFPDEKVKLQIPISTNANEMIKIDAGVLINDFPFILIEAKNMNYSINAVLQGLQYYGRNLQDNFIDNNPCFLFTISHGILFVYGVATANRRVVCDCLLTLEFTNYHFGINNFLNVLSRCVSSLFYFYSKFSDRMHHKDEDSIHKKYVEMKNSVTPNNQPLPAIFSVKSWDNDRERIEIEFESVPDYEDLGLDANVSVIAGQQLYKANIKTNVYLVKMVSRGNKLALLKVCFNYGIKAHDILAKNNMAPKIYGYERFRDNCQVVLMEYLDRNDSFESVFNYLGNNSDPNSNSDQMFDALEKFLNQVHSLNIVHGDFRSNNIFIRMKTNLSSSNDLEDDSKNELVSASESESSTSTSAFVSVFEFKLIDFEFSGMIGEKYPCLAMKNPAIEWHSSFVSFEPRNSIHDTFMFEKMKSRGI